MRRSVAASVVLSAGLFGAWVLEAGCTASGTEARINGQSYDLDAASNDAGAEGGALGDGGTSSPHTEAGATSDAGVADGASIDATFPDDASGESDAAGDAPSVSEAGTCGATTVVLGGNDFSIFGATATGTSAFTTEALTGSMGAAPALVAFGTGFEALVAEAGDANGGGALFGVGYSAGGWSPLTALGGNADAIDAPAVAVVGATLQGVYLNPEHLYFHAAFGAGWDTGADPVRPPNDAGGTAFGPVRAAAAGTATELVIAYEGSNGLPYVQTWNGTSWDDGVALGSSLLAVNTPMAIVALDSGANDLLIAYVAAGGSCSAGSGCLYSVVRAAATKTWSAPVTVDAAAYVNGAAPTAPTLASLTAGRGLLAWQGANGEGYESIYSGSAWSTPAQLTSAAIGGAPSLARGVCGDDAVAAYVSAGSVYTTHLSVGTWTMPMLLAGASGVVAVSIATAP